jgi:hypothetical protein
MSLSMLRDLRLDGQRPALVKLAIGAKRPLDDRPDLIALGADAQPERMDWRPLIGLPVALFVGDGHGDVAQRAFESAVAAGALPIGAAWSDVEVSTDEAIKPSLRRMWEVLCLS